MIGSMIVGFLIGLIASAISNRGERMGCIGKTFVGWLGAFVCLLYTSPSPRDTR